MMFSRSASETFDWSKAGMGALPLRTWLRTKSALMAFWLALSCGALPAWVPCPRWQPAQVLAKTNRPASALASAWVGNGGVGAAAAAVVPPAAVVVPAAVVA